MAGNSALGGFVEGLQGGITHRQQSLRNKKIDRMLDQEGKMQAMAIEGKQMDINKVRELKGLAPRDFTQFEADQDPYGFKLGDFFKPRKLWQNFKDNTGFGGGSMDAPTSPVQSNEAAIEDMTQGAQGSSLGMQGNTDDMSLMAAADGGPVRKMANGGSVEEQLDAMDRTRRPNPGSAESQLDRELDQKTRDRMNARQNPSRTRKALNTGKRVAGKAARLARAGAGVGGALAGAQGAVRGGFTDTEQMRREYTMPEALMVDKDDSDFEIFLKDLGARAIGVGNYVGDAALDMVGFGRDEAQAQAIRSSDVARPTQQEPSVAAQPQAATPRAAVQPPAAPQAPEVTGGPNQLADAPITDPGEMPTMNTEEWVAYRAASVESMLMQGMSLPEAHDAVTSMQQKGFLNYGTQALQMLAAGDPARAAMALKAAYQYFPNGVDVRFGITKDKQRQPALVAMGASEQTGESTGAPMLITGERLAVMMENMTNPDAFRTWTKDWREFEQDGSKYYEMEKPQAESENIYRDRMGRAALNRSEADLVGAYNAGRGGGRKRTDMDRNSAALRDYVAESGLL